MNARTLFVSSVALAALPFIVDSVQASSNTAGTVNATYLNVRTGPSTNDSVIGALPNQSSVTILGESGNWYKIQYNNQVAYVSKDYVTVSSSKYKVTADSLRVRSGASTSSSIIGMLGNGDEVTVESENNGWCKITYNNQAAYVSKAFLASSNSSTSSSVQSTSTFYVNADSLRFRTGPGTNYNIIDVLSSGQKVEVTGQSGSWYKVRYNGNDGYVSKDYLSTSQNVATSSSTSTSQASSILHWPASGGIVTSDFGPRWGSMHYGVDIAAPGNIQILAAASGTVSRSYYSTSYGNVVFLTHHINGQLYTTVYAHMKNRYVSEGDTVSQGQVLGYMGSTGEATGQHLHFELHKGEWNFAKSNAINPLPYLQH
ncbi:SH3 domain-containing protein [Ectobacillus sp. sgz5001026]|uniref:SH3 domain-containing protein n=1 Tax=Ectobacillus sp. sgz5001026 TaxID=3242473 RepID=UPI0036D21990